MCWYKIWEYEYVCIMREFYYFGRIKSWRNGIRSHILQCWRQRYRSIENCKSSIVHRNEVRLPRRETLGFPPRFEDLVSNFARFVTDRKAERLNRDHRMAKNALSKFSYNRSSSQHPPPAKPENFLTAWGTRVRFSWKHDSFRHVGSDSYNSSQNLLK